MKKILAGGVFFLLVAGMALLGGCRQKDDMITLRVYSTFSPQVLKYINGICRDFEKKHPKVRVKTEAITNSYYMKLQTMMAGGMAPDVIYMQNKSLIDYGDRNALLNLAAFIDMDKENLGFDDICRLGFEEGGIKDGKIYGIPFTGTAEVLIYNKNMFDQAGLQYPDETWTWNDMLSAARKLTLDTNGDGRIDQYGVSCLPGWWAADTTWIWANGGDVFNEDQSRCTVNNSRASEAMQFLVDLNIRYKVTPRDITGSEVNNVSDLFMGNRLAMYVGLPQKALSDFSAIKDFNWDITLMPRSNRGQRVARYTGECWSIFSGSKHPQAAWELVKYLSSKEVSEGMANLNMIPARLSVLNSPAFIKKQTPYREEMIVKALEEARAVPSLPRVEQINSIWVKHAEAMLLKNNTVSGALASAEKEINKVLHEYRIRRDEKR